MFSLEIAKLFELHSLFVVLDWFVGPTDDPRASHELPPIHSTPKGAQRLDRADAINMTLLTECKPDGPYAK